MLSKLFCVVFIIWVFFIFDEAHGIIFSKIIRQLNNESQSDEENNETNFSQESNMENTTENLWSEAFFTIPEENSTTETVLSDTEEVTEEHIAFFTSMETNLTTEAAVAETEDDNNTSEEIVEADINDDVNVQLNDTITEGTEPPTQNDPILEDSKPSETKTPTTSHPSYMNEKIVLPRNNCNLEIAVHETEDVKIMIKFEPLQNNTSGKCCIVLNGYEKTMLGVLISDVHLYRSNNTGEDLKVILPNFNNNFVLKQYDGVSQYQPLLLTETHKVYIILYYNVTSVTTKKYSHFNLEAFSYHKYENYVHGNDHYMNSYSNGYYGETKLDVDNIYFTTEHPLYYIN